MSLSGPKKGPPKYQNKFAFRHNPKSRKTAKILSLPNEGLCIKCHDIIEWKKKYRKYKSLTAAKKCTSCEQKTVSRAYHVICEKCAREQTICAKCLQKSEIVSEIRTKEEVHQEEKMLKEVLEEMSERQRRSYYRKLEKDPNYKLTEGEMQDILKSRDNFDGLDDLESEEQNENIESDENNDEDYFACKDALDDET